VISFQVFSENCLTASTLGNYISSSILGYGVSCQPDEREIFIAQFGMLCTKFGSVVYLC
jgi:hypothetical protein